MNIDTSNAHCGPRIRFPDHAWLRVVYRTAIRLLAYRYFIHFCIILSSERNVERSSLGVGGLFELTTITTASFETKRYKSGDTTLWRIRSLRCPIDRPSSPGALSSANARAHRADRRVCIEARHRVLASYVVMRRHSNATRVFHYASNDRRNDSKHT